MRIFRNPAQNYSQKQLIFHFFRYAMPDDSEQSPVILLTPSFSFVRIAYVEFYTPESVLMALAMSGS